MWHNHLWTGALSRKMRVSIPQIVAYLVYFLFLSLYDFTRKNKKDTNNDSQSFVLCLFICWDMCYIAIFFFYQSCSCHLIHIYIYIYIYVALSSCSLAFSMELGAQLWFIRITIVTPRWKMPTQVAPYLFFSLKKNYLQMIEQT